MTILCIITLVQSVDAWSRPFRLSVTVLVETWRQGRLPNWSNIS